MAQKEYTQFASYVDGGTAGVRSGFTAKHEHPTPAEIPAILQQLLKGNSYPPRDIWLSRPCWLLNQAACLALDLDPLFVEPEWKLAPAHEKTIRSFLAIFHDELLVRVGDEKPPAAYLSAFEAMGLHHRWLVSAVPPPTSCKRDRPPAPRAGRKGEHDWPLFVWIVLKLIGMANEERRDLSDRALLDEASNWYEDETGKAPGERAADFVRMIRKARE